MFRKMLIGPATMTAIGLASMPMNASARGGGHGGGFDGGGGFHGGMAMRGPTGGFGATRFATAPSRTGFGGMSGRGFHHHNLPPSPLPQFRLVRDRRALCLCGLSVR